MPWRTFFSRRRPVDALLDSEVGFHIEELIKDKIAAGLTPEQARREALLEFGGREQIKEELRDVHRMAALENTVANLKSGIRSIRKSPSFSITVILTLALGIGANSAVFSAIDAILLRPLPFPDADELTVLQQSERKTKNPPGPVAPIRLEEWNRLNSTFQAISGWYAQDVSDTSLGVPERVTEALVAPRFLQVLGVSPALGRDFTSEENRFGGLSAVLISDRYWRRRLNAEPNAVGKIVRLEKYAYTVVGVMPSAFAFPDRDVDIWCPSAPDAPYAQSREATWFAVIGRLKSGVTMAQGRADLVNLQARLGLQFPKTDANLTVDVQALKETTVGGVRRSLLVVFGSVSLLLLIACTNIASLMLARTTEREREISVRFSLGASRASVVAKLLTESFVLAVIGSALGLLVAWAGFKEIRILARSLPRAEGISLDWRIVLYTLGCATIATLLCGLFPALRCTRRNIAGELARASRTQVSTRNPAQWLLAGVQVALAVVLLVGAGLLLRTFEELGRVSPGFDPSHVMTLRVSGDWGETTDRNRLTQRINRILDGLRAIPGVSGAATSATLPGMPGNIRTELKLTEGRATTESRMVADSRFVSRDYFTTMKIPMLAGDGCREIPDRPTIVVNRSFAETYLRGPLAIGRHLALSSDLSIPPAEIRGIVADAREEGLTHVPAPTVYWCVSAPNPSPYFLIRTQRDANALATTIRREIYRLEPTRSVFDLSLLEQHLSDSFSENRLRTILLTLFALTAVSLACVGLYGTLSYFVTVRRREVGLRLAVGSSPGRIVRMFLMQGLGMSSIGCVIGLCLATVVARVLASLLYGVSTTDPETLVAVPMLMLTIAGLACLLPAARAARTDPMQVLRDE